MIELSVSLASNGGVKVPGYEQLVRFGYTKNRGVYRLAVTATGEWEGLAIRCFWHVPDGKDPASSLVVDGYVDVPASVTAQPGNGCITFAGSDGAKVMTSADLRYRVSANSGTEDGTEPEPSTPAWQQLVDAVHTDAATAEQAKTDAQTAAQQSEASAQKAGKALSDTITAKEDALKATKAAQTAASEAVTSAGSASQSAQEAADSLQELKDGIASGDFKGEPGNDGKSPIVTVTDIENGHRVSITDKDGTKTIDVLNGQTGKTGATPVLTIGTVSSGDKPSADITGTPENPVLNLMLQPGPQGPAVALDTTLTHDGEAADAKATGDAISAVKVRQNVLAGSEIGNPISVDDAFPAPLCGLAVYGKSTQDGTPSPDNPVPIVSAGDGGSVVVKVTGANMLEGTKPGVKSTVYGITYTTYENGFLITGTATNDFTTLLHDDVAHPLTRGIYYLTASGLSPSVTLNFYFVGKYSSDVQNKKVTLTRDVEFSLRLQIKKGTTLNTTVQVSLTRNAITAYSPYREQLLTLPTPGGLPGIPVASGGSYTDSTGQQWMCDEVDLERGVRVQRVDKAAFDSTKPLAEQNAILATPIETPLTPDEIAAYKALTTYGPDTVVQAGDGAGVKLVYQRDVNIAIKRIEDAIASMT